MKSIFEKELFSDIFQLFHVILYYSKNDVTLQRGMVMKILVIEDEKLLADSIRILLSKKGFDVEVACDGETGEEYAKLGIYDLLILDVMMPGMNGYEIAEKVRAMKCGVPILMLTAKSELEDRIRGLNSGELLACINALLRRQGSQVDEVSFGNTSLDLSSAMLLCGTNSIRLSAKEFDIMRLLLQAGDRNLSKETILARVWGYDSDAVENHVEVYIGFLRKKLTNIGSDIRIKAIRKMGYHLELEDL